MDIPTFSIIIPAYNTDAYISDCLDSLTEQTFQDFEIIVIDDGSTDTTPEILRNFKSTLSNLRVIRQKNRGVSCARNRGIDAAKGKFIYFLDSDDLIVSNALETISAFICKHPEAEIIHFNGKCFDLDTAIPTSSERYQRHLERPTTSVFLALANSGQFRASVCLYVIKRDYLKAMNLKFIEGQIHEDEAFTLIITSSTNSDLFITDSLFLRRERAGSITTMPKTTKNTLGYYHSCLTLTKWYLSERIDDDKREYVERRINFLFDTAVRLQLETGITNRLANLIIKNLNIHRKTIAKRKIIGAILPIKIAKILLSKYI